MAENLSEIGRNAFDEWCWRRGLELRDVVVGLQASAERLNAGTGRTLKAPSIETVRLIRLPFTDPRRRVPAAELMELIHDFTGAEIVAAHFYPGHAGGLGETSRTAEPRAAGARG